MILIGWAYLFNCKGCVTPPLIHKYTHSYTKTHTNTHMNVYIYRDSQRLTLLPIQTSSFRINALKIHTLPNWRPGIGRAGASTVDQSERSNGVVCVCVWCCLSYILSSECSLSLSLSLLSVSLYLSLCVS